MAATKSKDFNASVLAFQRQLDPSDALMAYGNWDDISNSRAWPQVEVREKAVRGTVANRRKAREGSDHAKFDAEIENPNPQVVDVATLPHDADTLMVSFTLKVLGGVGEPSACNNALHQARVSEIVSQYNDDDGFGTLAYRYAYNLACGRWLWRNRMKADDLKVRIEAVSDGRVQQAWSFLAKDLPLNEFESTGVGDLVAAEIDALASFMAEALSGGAPCFLRVEAFARMGEGQEVFPSQEMVMNKGRLDKSKVLYTVNGAGAAMHSQKIGNAIRTVDTWYPLALEGEGVGPIAAEPFGAVTSRGVAYRRPAEKLDFYTLYDKWVAKGDAPDPNQQHYVMSVLIRGGVFGESKKSE